MKSNKIDLVYVNYRKILIQRFLVQYTAKMHNKQFLKPKNTVFSVKIKPLLQILSDLVLKTKVYQSCQRTFCIFANTFFSQASRLDLRLHFTDQMLLTTINNKALYMLQNKVQLQSPLCWRTIL